MHPGSDISASRVNLSFSSSSCFCILIFLPDSAFFLALCILSPGDGEDGGGLLGGVVDGPEDGVEAGVSGSF